ncbi:hypothetical protein [Roseivirga sp. E12]|uniref:hypothetical protein n=1 Tax=Roseivirga sp. E12 TaxID=2819237 RepID=UPI001ABC9EC7|nr:hypothetical protein [Roseivirga sp. E12]MBO3698070.1 hypothetical protein [Roseivirga sp. E12]
MSPEALNLVRISQLSILIPLVLVLMSYKRFQPKKILLGLVIVFTFGAEVIAFLIVEFVQEPNNLPVYHVLVILLFFLFNRLYKHILKDTIKGEVFDVLMVLFTVFAILNSLWLQPLNTFNSNTIVTASIIYVFLSLIHFRQFLQLSILKPLSGDWTFWLSAGLLLYHSGSLMLFFFVNYVESVPKEVVTASWLLNALFNVFLNGFYTIALWKKSIA